MNEFLERELPGAMTFSAGYAGTRSIRQTALVELNAAPPGGGTAARPLAMAFGRTVGTSLNRRFKDGMLVKVSYTWSKAVNFNDNSDNGLLWNHPSVLARNRAVAGYDRTHVFRFAYVAELPFGPGKRWASNYGAGRALLGGWQLNGVFSSYTGQPFTVSSAGASLNAPGNSQTANQVERRFAKSAASDATLRSSIPRPSAPSPRRGSATPAATSCAGPVRSTSISGCFATSA